MDTLNMYVSVMSEINDNYYYSFFLKFDTHLFLTPIALCNTWMAPYGD